MSNLGMLLYYHIVEFGDVSDDFFGCVAVISYCTV